MEGPVEVAESERKLAPWRHKELRRECHFQEEVRTLLLLWSGKILLSERPGSAHHTSNAQSQSKRLRCAQIVEDRYDYLGRTCWTTLGPFLETGSIDCAYFAPWQLGCCHDDVKRCRDMRLSAEDQAHQGRNSIVAIHEMEPRIYKMPRFKTLLELDPSSRATGSELTEKAVSIWPTDDTECVAMKNRFSVMNDDDDDDATFDAEFCDFCD